jgi:hypothetical protein
MRSGAVVGCLCRRAVQRLDEADAVDGVRGVRPARDRPCLIALDPPDHVPANGCSAYKIGDFSGFIRRFLFA